MEVNDSHGLGLAAQLQPPPSVAAMQQPAAQVVPDQVANLNLQQDLLMHDTPHYANLPQDTPPLGQGSCTLL